ncbi:SHD1 domain-containing protein [Caulifigura coniformis]|uniref:SHD1 domain-containing protein n=1 Tax=Caulifigura coniformis TaxID=2527983 RepID=UPI0018D2569C|nr:SHD1 domain-containing protein [Caulifigura coniformis]
MTLSVSGGSLFAQAPQPRKWKDATNKFEIEATFVSEVNGLVTLRQTNGENVEIQLKELSSADIAYIRKERTNSKSPFKAKPDASPFEPKSRGRMPAKDAEQSRASNPTGPASIPVNWDEATLLAAPGASEWKAPAIEPEAKRKSKSSQIPPKRDFAEKLTHIATGEGFAILGYIEPVSRSRADSGKTRLVRVNLETGKTEGTILVEGVYALMDVSPNGEEFLMREEAEHGQPGSVLEIWKPAGKEIERLKAFSPLESEKSQNKVQVALLGVNGRAVVANYGNRGGIFNIADGQALTTAQKVYSACLSPDKKYAAILTDSLLVVDLESGDTIASLPTTLKHGAVLAFSPDGKRLAAGFSSAITAWDLATGEVYRDEIISGVTAVQTLPFLWTSPTHLLVGMTLVDLENHLPLWTYVGAERAANYGGATLLAADRAGQAGALVSTDLPHPAATTALKQALGSPGLFAVKPGTPVSIDVSGLPDAAEQEKVKSALETQLAAAGLKSTPGAPVTLKATLTSASKEEQYRVLGAGLETRSVNVTRYTSKVELVAGGQTAWQSSSGSGPSFLVRPKADETLEDAIRNSSKPNYDFFSKVSIPHYVMQPGKTSLGTSNVAGF